MWNALTFDVEDYFQVSAFDGLTDHSAWATRESRVEQNVDKLLSVLEPTGVKATFFTLGWVGERFPQTIRKLADAGHEIACHSHLHKKVFQIGRQAFREDTLRAKKTLEDAGGTQVTGYRAPSFSITDQAPWAFETLVEMGFTYDSSIFPVLHPNYGMPDARRDPHVIHTAAGPLVEFPMSALEFGGRRSPFGGGAYFRLLPGWFTHWAVRYQNAVEALPVNFYLHPWEVDPDQPRMNGTFSAKLRHYFGLKSTERKLHRLVREFQFVTLGSQVNTVLETASTERAELCKHLQTIA